jgi:curved DNA-binding protein CbpA
VRTSIVAPDDNYYAVLGVSSDATQEEIRKAFRERVRACHPDRLAGLDEDLQRLAEEKMVALNEAYAVLRNPARRAAHDDRHLKKQRPGAAAPAAESQASGGRAATSATQVRQPSRRRNAPLSNPAQARNRIGEQQFVARAAAEEFEHTVKRCVPGRIAWTPLAFRGATIALQAKKGRSKLYFVLLAAPQLDLRQVQRFLRSLEGFGHDLGSRLLGRDRLFGFAGAVEFTERDRQRRALERFNEARSARDAVQPVTFIDLVNWHVIPGETNLQTRLESLLRGS